MTQVASRPSHIPQPAQSRHTAGPCEVVKGKHGVPEVRKGGNTLARMHATSEGDMWDNAHLFAAADDHALVLREIAAGRLRWEPFTDQGMSGELCFDGIRHSTKLDAFGCPELTDHLRARLAEGGAL